MDPDHIENLETQLEDLMRDLNDSATLTGQFARELAQLRSTFQRTSAEMAALERGMSRGVRRAFDSVVLDGARLSDALQGLGHAMSRTVYSTAVKPVTDHFGSLLAQGVGALMPFAAGGAFSQGRVMPFAKGGVITGPTTFAMRGGTGLMGEAGPEAILPLSRGQDGRLGVRASGGQAPTVVMHITTPDAPSFHRSRAQIAAQMHRAMARANRIR